MGGVVPEPLHLIRPCTVQISQVQEAKCSKTMCKYIAKLIKENTVCELWITAVLLQLASVK